MTQPSPPVNVTSPAALRTRIEQSRTRMLVGHMPRSSLIVGGFGVIIVALVSAEGNKPIDAPTFIWLFTAVLLSLLRTARAINYLRSNTRHAPHWRPTFQALTGSFGLCWAALPWVLPLQGHAALESTIMGAMIGMSATGAAMLGFDKVHTRIWIGPLLGSAALYCIKIGGPLGWFGLISVLGFLIILWLESDRAHRRIGEMLRLRFESEQLAQARAQALQEAESLSAAKSRFLATMSHEMRTPLHGMLGLSRMLRDDLHDSTAQARMTLLQNAGEHLLGVINDVLDFSRLRENKLALKPRPTALQKLVSDVCELSDATAREKGLVVTVQSALPSDLWVEVDPERLRQILTNLVGNAVKFTRTGHVIIRLKEEACEAAGQARVAFEVEDTGDGIPPEHIGKIFDAFHQIDARDERQGGGTGLGLSIAQQICMAMQSEIRCESRLGVGSTFSFTLTVRRATPDAARRPCPATGDATAAAQRQEEEVGTLSGCILVVEDNPVNALVAQAMLEKTGLQAHVVENGRLALDWLAQHQADLVLMDCHMPEMGGMQATRLIRQKEAQTGAPAMPIVAVSAGKYHSDDHRQCLAVGMNDYLSKPFHRDDLLRVLRRHLPSQARADTAGATAGAQAAPPAAQGEPSGAATLPQPLPQPLPQ